MPAIGKTFLLEESVQSQSMGWPLFLSAFLIYQSLIDELSGKKDDEEGAASATKDSLIKIPRISVDACNK